MKSLLLMSVLLVTFALPTFAARDADAGRGFRKLAIGFGLFVVLYYFYIGYGHTRFFVPVRTF
jgi:hypothetical protein